MPIQIDVLCLYGEYVWILPIFVGRVDLYQVISVVPSVGPLASFLANT